MSLVDVINSFASGTYTVSRFGPGSFTSGVYSKGAAISTFEIVASIQPMSGRELQNLPEAQHGRETRLVLTATQLFTRTPDNSPDVISYKGEDWEVIRCEEWEAFGDIHYRAYISRDAIP